LSIQNRTDISHSLCAV